MHTKIDYFEVVDAGTPAHVIGVAVFLASHATVLTTDNELYSSDFFGVTSRLLESGAAGCLGGPNPPIVAVFNGAEGDVSPAWEQGKRDRRDVLEIASDVAGRNPTSPRSASVMPYRGSAKSPPTGACQRAMPDVWIEETSVKMEVAGPSGTDIVTVLTGVGKKNAISGKDATEWCGIWIVPPLTPVDDYHFRIDPIFGAAFKSSNFPVPGGPPFFETHGITKPLIADRPSGALCGFLSFLGLCPEPQTCQAP